MKRDYKKRTQTVCPGGEMDVIGRALSEGRRVLSEYESKQILRAYGIPVTRETEAHDMKGFKNALNEIGFPLVIKISSPDVSHKTERGLVHVDIRNRKEAMIAFKKILSETKAENASVLVQEMVIGDRELMMGLKRDPQFGPCVAFGLGGIFTEILQDICVRVAPIEKSEVVRMMKDFKAHRILDAFRGMPSADLDQIARMIITVGRIGIEEPRIKEIDINPVILAAGKPVAVDALVALH
ncbi:MAG: acetate--CoA ligase family protein [Syntrophorhabdus sp.]